MKRFLFAAAAFALLGVFAAAQEPKPAPAAQPAKAAPRVRPLQLQPVPAQPATAAGTALTRAAALKLAQAAEEVETLEANRDVRRAHVRAAEVGVKVAEVRLDHFGRGGAAPQFEVEKAKLEVEAAKAQLDIRVAEMRELEVKIKFAKKRLEDAKAGPAARPLPAPKAVDPPPPGGN